MSLIIPANYDPKLGIRQTEAAIKQIKDFFERALAEALALTRVSAPIFVLPETGLNDNLNGVERPVSFDVARIGHRQVEIVHSLAKWKRAALKRYHFHEGEGLYTDMNAIRRDDEMDNIHSIYVDQWDWERIIRKEERTLETLEATVRKIFGVFRQCQQYIRELYPCMETVVPDDIRFISSQELEDAYPELSPKEREDVICEKYKAVFITGIGGALASGEKHDGRAPDYDDWSLNGDMLFWSPVLGRAVELSSMGIRVDEETLLSQIRISGCEERMSYGFHQDVLHRRLPYTIGGGLGQSRICMLFLGKAHIGEVHASVWPEDMIRECEENGIQLL